jgi:hypothetical protein
VWRPEGKRTLIISRRRREDNTKMDLEKVGLDDMDHFYLVKG